VILYLHGFNSSPDSLKANLLKAYLAERGRRNDFFCPGLPWRFSEAAQRIDDKLRQIAQPVALVGSSLGGFYATHFAEKYGLPAVLVNPAVDPPASLSRYLGPQRNLYTGEQFLLAPKHLKELEVLAVPRITRPERYLLLAETGDEVLDYREAVTRYAGATQIVIQGGDHAFRDFADYLEQVVAFADRHAARPRAVC
jgi:predicted esterase YcpF (UPF0227 family)